MHVVPCHKIITHTFPIIVKSHTTMKFDGLENDFRQIKIVLFSLPLCFSTMASWPNGKALDYESRDCMFESCRGH